MTADRNAKTDLEGVVARRRRARSRPSRFAAGEGLSEHTAPFDALVLMIEGESEISIGSTSHRLIGGQLLQLPARQPPSR